MNVLKDLAKDMPFVERKYVRKFPVPSNSDEMFEDLNKLYTHSEILDLNYQTPTDPILSRIFGEFDWEDGYLTMFLRDDYIRSFGYHVVTKELLESINEVIKDLKVTNIVELMAGTGYFGKHLKTFLPNNVNLTMVDDKSWHFDNEYWNNQENITLADVNEFELKDYDLVILAWPNYESPTGFNILKNMKPNQYLLYCGESSGGCTADDDFFEYLETDFEFFLEHSKNINEHNINFEGIHSYWELYRKRD